MFEVVTYKDADLPAGAIIALENRLWVAGWCLQGDLKYKFMRTGAKGEMAIGFLDKKPICVVVHDTHQVMAFCRKALRGKGYASKCLAAINTKDIYAQAGIKGSGKFWEKNDIPCY